MRLIALVICGLALQISCLAQSDYSIPIVTKDSRFASFVSSFKAKKKSESKLVRSLFNKAHRDYLKNYVAYSQVEDIFKSGNYDCLSGTYFLARALEELNISYRIFETNYHIFLTVQTEQGQILIESTDRINGLVQNQKAIDKRIASYQQTNSLSTDSELYLSRVKIFHELHTQQLPGLLYYNLAVVAYNKNDLSSSCAYLEQAWKIYDNQRVEVFAPILIQALVTCEMEKSAKEKLIQLIQAHQQTSFHTIASR
ncbi:MAG TPA: hypothetical protein VN457_02250 [Chlamydiales bacterium]|nr:hypothetical protein [Chlamydiales bacterium]